VRSDWKLQNELPGGVPPPNEVVWPFVLATDGFVVDPDSFEMTTDGGLGSGTWADFLHRVAIIPAKTTARSNARVLNRLVGRDCVFIDLVEFSEYGFGEDLVVCAGQIERAFDIGVACRVDQGGNVFVQCPRPARDVR